MLYFVCIPGTILLNTGIPLWKALKPLANRGSEPSKSAPVTVQRWLERSPTRPLCQQPIYIPFTFKRRAGPPRAQGAETVHFLRFSWANCGEAVRFREQSSNSRGDSLGERRFIARNNAWTGSSAGAGRGQSEAHPVEKDKKLRAFHAQTCEGREKWNRSFDREQGCLPAVQNSSEDHAYSASFEPSPTSSS